MSYKYLIIFSKIISNSSSFSEPNKVLKRLVINFYVWKLQLQLSLRNSFENGGGVAVNNEKEEDDGRKEIDTVLSLSLSSSSSRQQEEEESRQTNSSKLQHMGLST